MIVMAVIFIVAGCGSSVETPVLPDFQSIAPEEALQRLDSDEEIVLLDVRTPEEYAEGRIPGSLLIPLQTLKEEAPLQLTDKEAPIFVYCRSGNRSLEAARILVELGYTQVYDLGGIIDWPYDIEK
jgi:rhodanese-related sulfurtransferase